MLILYTDLRIDRKKPEMNIKVHKQYIRVHQENKFSPETFTRQCISETAYTKKISFCPKLFKGWTLV